MRFQALMLSVVVIAAVGMGRLACGAEPPAQPQGEKKAAGNNEPEKAAPLVTIGKDTTFVTGPLREDGSLDLMEAINEHASEGVTPENNAAIPFWQIVGPAQIEPSIRESYFKKLGIETPPEPGDYYISFSEYLKLVEQGEVPGSDQLTDDDPAVAQAKRNQLEQQHITATQRLWDTKEFPIVADWLAKNDKQLDQLVEAMKRPRFYSPYVGSEEGTEAVMAMLLPVALAARDVSRALVCRATLRIAAGQIAEAQADLLASHRLGRLLAHGETLIELLVAIAIDSMANTGERVLANSGKLTSKQLLDYAVELRSLDPMAPMADCIDFTERLMFVDCTLLIARGGMTGLKKVLGEDVIEEPTLKRIVERLIAGGVDWDTVLRKGNAWYDRLAAAGREPDYLKQKAAFEQLDGDIRVMYKNARDLRSFAVLSLAKGLQAAVSERMGDLLISMLLPGINTAFTAEKRSQVFNDQTQLALALAAYHADQGEYPMELQALVPKYLEAVPLDRFSGEACHYSANKNGYLLYSVGPNGKDEEGRNPFDDIEEDEPGDDPAVRASK